MRRRAALGGLAAPILVARLGAVATAAPVNNILVGRDGWLFSAWDEVDRVDFGRLRAAAAVINDAVGTLKRAGIEVAIPVIPQKARLYRDFLPPDVRVSAAADRRYATTLTELRRPGTLVPDLDTLFREHRRARPAELLYLRQDSHWTALGAELAATEVARGIQERLRLPPSPRPGTELGPAVEVSNTGSDLFVRLPQAERDRLQAGETFPAHVPVARAAAALTDDDGADVAIVGNSYMVQRYNFQPMLSNRLGRPVYVLWRFNTMGPYRTLLEYLGTEAFRAARPKLIVWVFRELDIENEASNPAWGTASMPAATFLAQLRQAVAPR